MSIIDLRLRGGIRHMQYFYVIRTVPAYAGSAP